MATGNHFSPTTPSLTVAPRSNWRLRVALIAVAAIAAALLVMWPTIRGYSLTGTSYGARVACSCRYVGGRSLSDCRKDFEPGMALVSLSEDSAQKSVTARMALMFPQTVTYRKGSGCVLQPWQD